MKLSFHSCETWPRLFHHHHIIHLQIYFQVYAQKCLVTAWMMHILTCAAFPQQPTYPSSGWSCYQCSCRSHCKVWYVSVTFMYYKKSMIHLHYNAVGTRCVTGTNERLMTRSLMQPFETIHQTMICHIPFDTSVISSKFKLSWIKHVYIFHPWAKILTWTVNTMQSVNFTNQQ